MYSIYHDLICVKTKYILTLVFGQTYKTECDHVYINDTNGSKDDL